MEDMPLLRPSPDDLIITPEGNLVLVEIKNTEMKKVPLNYQIQVWLQTLYLESAGFKVDKAELVCKAASKDLDSNPEQFFVNSLGVSCPESIKNIIQDVYNEMVECLMTDQPPAPRLRGNVESLESSLTSSEKALIHKTQSIRCLIKEATSRVKEMEGELKKMLAASEIDLSTTKVEMGAFKASEQTTKRTDVDALRENLRESLGREGVGEDRAEALFDEALTKSQKTTKSVVLRSKTAKQNPNLEWMQEMAHDQVESLLQSVTKNDLESELLNDLDQVLDADEGPGL